MAEGFDHLVGGLRMDVTVFGALGAVVIWRSGVRRPVALAGLMLLLFGLGTVYSKHQGWFGTDRYFSIPLTVTFLVAAGGWCWLWSRTRAMRGRLVVRALLVLVLGFVAFDSVEPRRERHAARLQALEWVRDRGPVGEPLVVERRRDGWYAERPVILAPLTSDEASLLALVEAHGGGYMLYELEDLEELAPHWLEEGGRVREVKRFEQEGAKTVVLLRAGSTRDS